MKWLIWFTALWLLPSLKTSGCTIFNATTKNTVLVGNNEDWNNLNNSIRFYPASDHKFGRMLFIINKNGYPFGGMNDQGLFFDWCALTRRSDIKFPADRETYKGTLCEKMLAECANVEEVIKLYRKYNDPWLYEGHMMAVDKSGASVIIEWGKDSLEIIRKEKAYQVLTNFTISDPGLAGWYPCRRYEIANQMLDTAKQYSRELFLNILNAVHQNGTYQTIYSEIYDLKQGTVNFYYMHRYDKAVIINLSQELGKGRRQFPVQDILSQLDLIDPLQKETPASDSVTFKWTGDADSYKLYCSEDPSFNGCDPVTIRSDQKDKSSFGFLFALPFILLILMGNQRKGKIITLLFLVAILTAPGCEKDMDDDIPVKSYSYTLAKLKPGTRYYWKIAACNRNGFVTESNTRYFNRGE